MFSRPYLADQRPANIMLDLFAGYIFLKDKIQIYLALSAAFHINAQDCTHSYGDIRQSALS